MPLYAVHYKMISSRVSLVEADNEQEAQELWNDDESIVEDYESDSDYRVEEIERIDD